MYSGIPVTYLFYLQKVNTVQIFDNDFYRMCLVFQRPRKKKNKRKKSLRIMGVTVWTEVYFS